MERLRWNQSLFWRLAQLLFFLVAATVVVHSAAFVLLHRLFEDRVRQLGSWDLAERLAADVEPLTSGSLQMERIEEVLFRFVNLNPVTSVSILDGSGAIIYSSSHQHTTAVAMDPILEFLAVEGYPALPVYGTDPDDPKMEDEVPFSAAPINIGGSKGYLYVVLSNRFHNTLYRMFGDASIAAGSAGFLVSLTLVSFGAGAAMVHFLTRPFRRLTAAIERFSAGDYSVRVPPGRQDEIGLHGRAFNSMAATIEKNINTLVEADSLRRQLIANISHDIRSPLGAMMSLLDALESDFDEMPRQEQKLFISRALLNCTQLKTLVDDLFELSKLNARSEAAQTAPVNLGLLIQSIISRLAPQAQAKNVALLFDGASSPLGVMADEKLLNRALSNLVENAIRYSHADGEVRISCLEHPDGAVELSVADKGMGIASEDLEHIFQRFYRGTRAQHQEKSGSGLGLAITKRILELHGSGIEVQSRQGEGAVFRFFLRKA